MCTANVAKVCDWDKFGKLCITWCWIGSLRCWWWWDWWRKLMIPNTSSRSYWPRIGLTLPPSPSATTARHFLYKFQPFLATCNDRYHENVFIGPMSDHSLPMSATQWLTSKQRPCWNQIKTPSCYIDFFKLIYMDLSKVFIDLSKLLYILHVTCILALCQTQQSWSLNMLLWLILRCWGNSSILCQQNSDAL